MTSEVVAAGPVIRRGRRSDILRSASLRLALVYALLFMLSAIVFMSFIWWATIGLLEREVDAQIDTDARALSEQWTGGGLPALAETIQQRLADNVDDDALYLMVDASGSRIAGNLLPGRATSRAPTSPTSCRSRAPASAAWPRCTPLPCRAGSGCWWGGTCVRARSSGGC